MLAVRGGIQVEECCDPAGARASAGRKSAPKGMAADAHRGSLRVGRRSLGIGETLRFEPDAEKVHIIVVTAGAVSVGDVREAGILAAGQALLAAQAAPFVVAARGIAGLLLIDVSRTALQARCFAKWREPRRIGRANLVLPASDGTTASGETIQSLLTLNIIPLRTGQQARIGDADAIVETLADALRTSRNADSLFPVAGSVLRALDRLAEIGAEPVTDEDVVRAAGVTRLTLRRAVKETTGIPLGKLLGDARLDWARSRLQSNHESRSLAALANVLDYRPTVFARTYQRRFGETPTQTRARAFKAGR